MGENMEYFRKGMEVLEELDRKFEAEKYNIWNKNY